MLVSEPITPQDATLVTLEALPTYRFLDGKRTELQVAEHLKKALENQGAGNLPTIHLPSVLALAGFYHCSILDVLDALFHLKNENYAYAMNGLDDAITLQDPLDRKQLFFSHTPGLWQELFSKKGL